ncbi:metallophosphoesterase [Streptosporangium lutulentum]
MIVIAHLSDIHIDGGQRSIGRTQAVMDHLEDLPYDLDAVLVTGDIADHALRPSTSRPVGCWSRGTRY